MKDVNSRKALQGISQFMSMRYTHILHICVCLCVTGSLKENKHTYKEKRKERNGND